MAAKEAQIVALRDQWLVARGKAGPKTKARIKKVVAAEKKLLEKQEKARKKARSKNPSIGIRRLALSNSHAVEFGTFKDVLSDPATAPPDNKTLFSQELLGAPSNSPPTDTLTVTRLQNSEKKKAKGQMISERLNTGKRSGKAPPKSPTPPPVAMELIRPGKQRVRVPANAVKSTSPKRMRQ